MKIRLIIILALSSITNLAVAAQQTASPGSNQTAIPEITVTNNLARVNYMRDQIIIAEDKAFNLFNEHNDEDEYDIRCIYAARTATRIRSRQCATNYLFDAQANDGQQFLALYQDMPTQNTDPRVAVVLAIKNPILKEKMETLSAANPELNQALMDHYELSQELQEIMDSHYHRD